MSADPYAFRYRLFASVDIAGSTAFKAGSNPVTMVESSARWVQTFRSFFEDFPSELRRRFEAIEPRGLFGDCKPPSSMVVWKFVGDEILFTSLLDRHEHASFHVLALKHALESFETFFHTKELPLGLKATVWGAGFPVTNAEIPTWIDGTRIADFVGPHIDLGFRLARCADSRRLVVSADIAYMIAKTPSSGTPPLRIFLDSPASFKGVRGGAPYPVFWIDRAPPGHPEDKLLLGKIRDYNVTDLAAYVESLFEAKQARIHKPFFENDPHPDFQGPPEKFVQMRDRLRDEDADSRLPPDSGGEPPPTGVKREPPPPTPLERPKRASKGRAIRRKRT